MRGILYNANNLGKMGMESMELFCQLCWPALFYGFLIDAASLLLRHSGSLEAAFAGALAALPFLWRAYARMEGKKPKFGRKAAFLCILGGTGGCLLINLLAEAVRMGERGSGFSKVTAQMAGEPFWLRICAVGVVLPLAEELVFRGLVFKKARTKWPFWPAAAMSALLFGIYHGNFPQGIYGCLMGILFAWAMEKQETLLAPVLMHMSANLLSVAVTGPWGTR